MRNTLYSPVQLGDLTLSNRLVMAPMTRNRAAEGNVPTDLNATYYQQRSNAGLIITEASQVSAEGVGYPATPGIHSDAQVAGWHKVTETVHKAGGKIFIQLWYCGRISHPSLLPDNQTPVAPSAIQPEGEAFTYEGLKPFVQPRALESDEIPAIVEQYRHAAQQAKAAGFDGIEIHAANGYLIDQFLRDGSNQRTDMYGGSLENRTRFLNQVLDAVCSVWPANRVGVRLSPENGFNSMQDSDPQTTFEYVAGELSHYGLAYLHVLEGDMLSGDSTLDYAAIKNRFNGIYIANNGYDKSRAETAVTNGQTDLVAFGQLYLANPDLLERFQSNAPLNSADPNTFYGGDEHGYTDYPFLETETVTA